MLTGQRPDDASVRALETYLNTVVDHGTERLDVRGARHHRDAFGPCFGGDWRGRRIERSAAWWHRPALDMVFEIGSLDRAEADLRARLERGAA